MAFFVPYPITCHPLHYKTKLSTLSVIHYPKLIHVITKKSNANFQALPNKKEIPLEAFTIGYKIVRNLQPMRPPKFFDIVISLSGKCFPKCRHKQV